MKNCWSEAKAAEFIQKYGASSGEDFSLRLYAASLIGVQDRLVLHGGGNSSVKTLSKNIFGEPVYTIFVKASGFPMAMIEPRIFTGLDLDYLKKLRVLPELSDEEMLNEFQTHRWDSQAAPPSIETLVHAFLPQKFIDHTHADAILALTNQQDGEKHVRAALGKDVVILDYVAPGFKLAQAAAAAFEANPGSKAMVWMRHGLVSWGDTARTSYNATVDLITRAEDYLASHANRPLIVAVSTPLYVAEARFADMAPMARGLLARNTGDPDQPFRRCVLQPLIDRSTLDFLDSDRGRDLALTSPLTADHLIRTKPFPLWIEAPQFADPEKLRAQLSQGISDYSRCYEAYVDKYAARMPKGVERMDPLPRIILLPGLGAICTGQDVAGAAIVRNIAAHTLAVKAQIGAMGIYCGLEEKDLFSMEYRSLQHAKLRSNEHLPLASEVAVITGAAGAIGSGIALELLEQGCHVAVTDLPGENLNSLAAELALRYGARILGVPLDVTDPESVKDAFRVIVRAWGGIDLVIVNAGMAHVSSLEEMNLDSFRSLEKVNIEGTLIVIAEAGRHFRVQKTGGDIVMVSTKNVFAPGAKFGAYSATKSAAHQLARIASLEFAEYGVRVNMVSPDAVFSHGSRKSGLWATVGPDRMTARGLSAEGLEAYYRDRNLLKARVTAQHVAKAVLFFATRQTPTTGATIPVDGGLPDATPR